MSSLAVYSSPSDRSGPLPTDVPASPSRTGFEWRVCVGRNPSAHLPFRGGGWSLQIRLLSHSEDIQSVRWSMCPESPALRSDMLAPLHRCEGKPAVELTKFVRIDMNTGEVELPKGCVQSPFPEFHSTPSAHHSHPMPRGKLWSQVKRYSSDQ